MASSPEVTEYLTERIEDKPIQQEEEKSVHHLWTKAHAAEQFTLNTQKWKNWNETITCQPTYFHRPETKEQIFEILSYARKHDENVRVIGSGHSYNNIGCTDGHMISLERFCRILKVDRTACLVKVESGITLARLNERLNEIGLALRNLGSSSDHSISGAISTGTHGTGIGFGILSTDVVEMEIILADCSEIRCSRKENTNIFLAALCSLGAIGIISTITLHCEQLYQLDAVQYPIPIDTLLGELTKIVSSAEHVRIWWFPHTDKCIVWQANRARNTHPIGHTLRQNLTEIKEKLIGYYSLEFMYYLSTYNEKMIPYINKLYRRLLFNKTKAEQDLSYKVFNFDNLFKKYAYECTIPVDNLYQALITLKNMIGSKKYRVHFPVEINFVKGDDIWLSPAYGGDKACIGLLMYRPYGRDVAYTKYFNEFETKMSTLGGRPHWAKYHRWTKVECQKSYPMFEEFIKLREKLDPTKLFINDYLQRIFEIK